MDKIYELVISINVFEKLDYIKEQIKNIIFFTKYIKVLIIFNCNDLMYDLLNNIKIDEIDILVNPEIINKKRWHGSLLKGIFSNLNFILLNEIKFNYFLILQSRNFFINRLIFKKIDNYFKYTSKLINDYKNNNCKFILNYNLLNHLLLDQTTFSENDNYDTILDEISNNKKYRFFNSKTIYNNNWFNKLYQESDIMIQGKHECLCFTYDVSIKINEYLNLNKNISNDIYNTESAVEEIVPHILANICSINNYYYTYIPSNIIQITKWKNYYDKRQINDIEDLYKKYNIVID
jgi:hypothetical protein